ncbi:non-ribosomal peptide synthetase [Sphaerisporangium corydalis]|uniref:AMP-binding protein n=1 Tax=Sphaerisporangium corydalis TaxID=1441875 RepID=A0ABV9EKJ4_9ACTN|nr:non-ribosomal peptide synthetase [Sphaerisporangium corydalis]
MTEHNVVQRRLPASAEKRRIIERVHLHAVTTPSRIAIEQGTRSIDYAALGRMLDERSEALSSSVAPGALVPVEHRRSVEFVVDFLALLALGGTPVPVDPGLPARRRETLLGLIGEGAPGRGPGAPAAPGAEEAGATAGSGDGDDGGDGAYVFFTSGSTGMPKPVLGSAAALRSFLEWQCAEFGVDAGDRVAFLTALSFDVVVRDVFLPLWAGATLVIPDEHEADSPEATVAWLDRARVSVVNVVPSVARSWSRHGLNRCESMRKVFFAGEPLTAGLLDEWHATFPGTRVRANFYGTTETALPKIYKRLERVESHAGILPAGRPLPDTRYCLVEPGEPFDADLVRAALCLPPVEGEVVLVSRYSGHGYVGMPEETAARFADLGDGVTAYRTGDLGRVDRGGELVVSGRADDELKVNGVRIHPAEVAAAIRAVGFVADVFVTAEQVNGPRLTAYVVPAEGSALDLVDLRGRLTATMPPAMIPTAFVELEALPSLPNGKVDRVALSVIGRERVLGRPFSAPAGEIECWLADRYTELFGIRTVSANDDFFALGGDSISAMRLASRIRRDLGVALSVRDIFAGASVAAIAREIADQRFLAMDAEELLAMLDRVEAGFGAASDGYGEGPA